MKLHILSDLHLESGPVSLPATDADVVVLAGDIDHGGRGLMWAHGQFPNQPVVFVAGNHEFFGSSPEVVLERLRTAETYGHVSFLENNSATLNGWTFLGCTLWSDFNLYGQPQVAMREASSYLPDYYAIRGADYEFTPHETLKIHQASVCWLKDKLGTVDSRRTVVVTHHAPSVRAVAPWNRGKPLSAAFVSALDQMVESSGVPLWIHGHTHYNTQYKVGNTQVVCNQRGFDTHPRPLFKPDFTVEL